MQEKKRMLSAWIIGKSTYTLIITKELAEASGFSNNDQVIVESNKDEIVVKKLESVTPS